MQLYRKELRTKRLCLRHFQEEDAKACYQSWGQDERLGRYIVLYPMVHIEQMEALVSSMAQMEHAWLIQKEESNEIIGYITMDIPYEQLGIGEIGYVIGERYQKQGFATEAIHEVLHEYLVNRKLYMIEARYNETNEASEKILKKMGFQVDGILRGRRIDGITGERNHLVVCSIKAEEFAETNV